MNANPFPCASRPRLHAPGHGMRNPSPPGLLLRRHPCRSPPSFSRTSPSITNISPRSTDYVNAVIQPQVSGYLVAQNYQEGALVREERHPLQHRSASIPGRARHGEGAARASRGAARESGAGRAARHAAGPEKGHSARASSITTLQASLAAKAIVQADKAAVEQAELNLEFTDVRSLRSMASRGSRQDRSATSSVRNPS